MVGDDAIELRPKAVWRFGLPLAIVATIGGAVLFDHVLYALGALCFVPSAIRSWIERVTIANQVLYRKIWVWHEPLLLDQLTGAWIHVEGGQNQPHSVLTLLDAFGTYEKFALLWLADWKVLGDLIDRKHAEGTITLDRMTLKTINAYKHPWWKS